MMYLSLGMESAPGIMPMMLCPAAPVGVVKWLPYEPLIGISPPFSNFLSIQNAASTAPLVPVARPLQSESVRNDISRWSFSSLMTDNEFAVSIFQSPRADVL